ncbi:galactokinase [Streptomyces sp. NPDC003042]
MSRTAREFRKLYGNPPEGVWAAPGRVNLIGEHTDYNDGFVLPFALAQRTEVAAARRTDGILRFHSADIPSGVVTVDLAALDPARPPQGVAGWAGYPAGVVWALVEADLPVSGVDLHVRSDVPAGAGLSSSAALEVATALALADLYGLELTRPELAALARRAENTYVGVPCGVMDQMASACATEGHVLHLDTRTLEQRHIPFDCAASGLRLLVIDTRVRHDLADGAYAERRASCHRAAAALGLPALRDLPYEELDPALARLGDDPVGRRRVRHVVTENERVLRVEELLRAGRLRATGPLLTEGHASLRDDYEVSCPELDLAVATANAAGAYGARMTGGGFGGSALALIDADAEPVVTRAVTKAFGEAGFTPPRITAATPSAGAVRLR